MRELSRTLATMSPAWYLLGSIVIAAFLIWLTGILEDRYEHAQLRFEHENREALRLANSRPRIRIPDHVPDEWLA